MVNEKSCLFSEMNLPVLYIPWLILTSTFYFSCYIRVFILDTKPERKPKNPRAMSQYVLPTYIDIRKEKRKCKSRESWTKVSTAIPCHPLLLPAFLFMRKSAFSIDLFSERLLMSEIAVSSGGILFCGTKTSEFPILWKMSTWRPPT